VTGDLTDGCREVTRERGDHGGYGRAAAVAVTSTVLSTGGSRS
jgi:hypothetical protein